MSLSPLVVWEGNCNPAHHAIAIDYRGKYAKQQCFFKFEEITQEFACSVSILKEVQWKCNLSEISQEGPNYDIMEAHGMNHTPHECRHTFRSWLDSADANKVCIDKIMGHTSANTGERIYTHKSIEELKIAIELITI